MTSLEILKRLFKDYTKKFIGKIILSVFFSMLVAASTSIIAYLLDPAIEKIFIEKDEKLMLLIPFAILFAFALKGSSLYLAKVTLIKVGGEIQKILQLEIMESILVSSVEKIDKKHSGKIITNLILLGLWELRGYKYLFFLYLIFNFRMLRGESILNLID